MFLYVQMHLLSCCIYILVHRFLVMLEKRFYHFLYHTILYDAAVALSQDNHYRAFVAMTKITFVLRVYFCIHSAAHQTKNLASKTVCTPTNTPPKQQASQLSPSTLGTLPQLTRSKSRNNLDLGRGQFTATVSVSHDGSGHVSSKRQNEVRRVATTLGVIHHRDRYRLDLLPGTFADLSFQQQN